MTLTEILSLDTEYKEIVLENVLGKYGVTFEYNPQSGVWSLFNREGALFLEGVTSSRDTAVSSLLAHYLAGSGHSPRVEGGVGFREVTPPVERSPLSPDLDPKEIYDAIKHILPHGH